MGIEGEWLESENNKEKLAMEEKRGHCLKSLFSSSCLPLFTSLAMNKEGERRIVSDEKLQQKRTQCLLLFSSLLFTLFNKQSDKSGI